jgi:NADPH:quinone reductase-like Zn-dependent oxidoreductase
MKAIQLNEFGNANELKPVTISVPSLQQDDELLIKVKYSGITPVDLKIRSVFMNKILPEQFPAVFPAILGWEASGIVEAVGESVTNLEKGDEVFGMLPFYKSGTYTEYLVMNESELGKKNRPWA